MELALLCNKIENNALGTSIGYLDQYGIIFAKSNQFFVIDFNNNNIEYIPAKINGYSWIIINSKKNRELVTSAYNQRVQECHRGFKILSNKYNISSLRDIDKSMLYSLKDDHKLIYNRLKHVYYENLRVLKMIDCIHKSDANNIGALLHESHASLQLLYEVSCSEIDYLIKFSEKQDGWCGGRIIGGGFGGCSLHLIEDIYVDIYIKNIIKVYKNKFAISLEVNKVEFCGGIQIV